jgi:hypothetical protein
MGRDHEREPEHDEQQLSEQVERRHDDPEPVQRRAAHDADESDENDHRDADDDVPRIVLQCMHLQRPTEVVRQEQRRERDHDQVVEEESPAGHEAREVVERPPHERRRTAGLGQCCSAFRVRQRDDQEEHAGGEQDDRREAERMRREHAEREVDRRCDLAVGDREQRTRVELTPQAGELPRH